MPGQPALAHTRPDERAPDQEVAALSGGGRGGSSVPGGGGASAPGTMAAAPGVVGSASALVWQPRRLLWACVAPRHSPCQSVVGAKGTAVELQSLESTTPMLVSKPTRLSAITRSSSQVSAATLTCWPSACSAPTKPSGWKGRSGKVPSSRGVAPLSFVVIVAMSGPPFYRWVQRVQYCAIPCTQFG